MIIIGLTGSIGMGKSTAVDILRDMGIPAYNADHAVHDLLKKGGAAVKPVAKLFPEALQKGAIDRGTVALSVFHHPAKLKKLEAILHPLVRKAERAFLAKARKQKARAVVLEIPLLFETGADARCDVTLCVTAPKTVQKQRVMARPGMTDAKFKAILDRQMPDSEKRRRADYIIKTGTSYADTKMQLKRVIARLLEA